MVLCEWVEATGGWSDAGAIHLPTSLPNCLALATLKAHARCIGLAVTDDAEIKRLLAAGQRAANPDLATDPGELMLQAGCQS